MISGCKSKVKQLVVALRHYAHRVWYPPLIGLLAGIDNLILIIPTDGILISSSMLLPKRWALFGFSMAIGSTLGALILAGLVEWHGLPWIAENFGSVMTTSSWSWSSQFFDRFGLAFVFLIAVSPLVQMPVVILAALHNTPLFELGVAILLGRMIKFLVLGYLSSHTPRLLGRLWGLKSEMEDAGVQLDQKTPN